MDVFSDHSNPLPVEFASSWNTLKSFNGVVMVLLPEMRGNERLELTALFSDLHIRFADHGVVVTLASPPDLVHVHEVLGKHFRFQSWIAVKRKAAAPGLAATNLVNGHAGLMVHTKYNSSLIHAPLRSRYTICPACNKTTKDYGGKKHTFHESGTLISDVWKDLELDCSGDPGKICQIVSQLFGVDVYEKMVVIDLRKKSLPVIRRTLTGQYGEDSATLFENVLINDDCIGALKKIPDNSIDFVFADPPYNIRKKYSGYEDGEEIEKYFAWCDQWLAELIRVLKPGRTLAVLNIPLWSIRHFQFLDHHLNFQNWIVWESMSLPVRRIMPSHYGILSFAKGQPAPVAAYGNDYAFPDAYREVLRPIKQHYCMRAACVKKRNNEETRENFITDLWSDIHRLKHNSRRVDHPCLLPPQLMYRLYAAFTQPGDLVLDCFNGAGTSTLCAAQMSRRYIGIELSPEYHTLAQQRHAQLEEGIDPFRKQSRVLVSKNSRVGRVKKNETPFTKKEIQLDVKAVATSLGKIPTKDEYSVKGKYPMEIIESLFAGWADACAAAKHVVK